MDFEVAFSYEVEEGVVLPVRVVGHKNPVVPAKMDGHPDDRHPAEGGELEDLKVFSGQRLMPALERMLLQDERFIEMVEAAL